MPFFSVVIPTHNRSLLLKRAINSVLNQTYANFEVIIVDDHSTDDTSEILESYKNTRLKYMLNQRNKGACGARNTGIFVAKGKWVAFLDDDDVWYEDKLKKQYELILKGKKTVGLVCSDYEIFKGEGKKIVEVKNRPSGWVREKILYGGCIGCLSSVCVRIDILIDINGFDETFPSNQDQDLYLRVAKVSEFSSVPETLVYIYQEKRKDRIEYNFQKKLDGWRLLKEKHINLISKNRKIRQRIETTLFSYAFLQKDLHSIKSSFLWLIYCAFFEFPFFLRTVLTTTLYFNKKKRLK